MKRKKGTAKEKKGKYESRWQMNRSNTRVKARRQKDIFLGGGGYTVFKLFYVL